MQGYKITKSQYREVVLRKYGETLHRKVSKGKMEGSDYWRLQGKLTEWFHNYPSTSNTN